MTITLDDAKQTLRAGWERGVDCPCCGQFVKLYRRKLNSSMAYALIMIARHDRRRPGEFFHVPAWLDALAVPSAVARGDFAKLRFWGLIEPQPDTRRADGSKRAGFWRITPLGRDFAAGRVSVPSHVYLYNQKPIGRTPPGRATIREALGDRFDFGELMAATPEHALG